MGRSRQVKLARLSAEFSRRWGIATGGQENVMNIETIVKELQKERQLFHSEADFQHALAWEIHRHHPSAAVRLETNLGLSQRALVDIWVKDGDTNYAIELKYKTSKLDVTCQGEEFHILNHGAQDIGRYDFIRDICRLESFVGTHPRTIGYALFLTNDENYWKRTKRLTTADAMFRLHDNCTLKGELRWSAATGKGTMNGRENPLNLRGSYVVQWSDYSELEGKGPRTFRYVLLQVEREAAAIGAA
jgi:hypothetical protein